MTNFPLNFYEWDVPPAGIDTISLWIHPYLVNDYTAFHKKGNANSPINLRTKKEIDYKTKKIIRTNYIMDIQAEAINPNNNILIQIFNYIIKLFYSNTLSLQNIPDEKLLISFLEHNFNALFAIDFIDFYFDIKEEDAILLGIRNDRYPNTQYSNDNSIKTYNRIVRLKQKNTIAHKYIEKISNPRRIEFHLTRNTCRYLHFCNLNGNYDKVFLVYLHFLARKWRKNKRQIIDISNITESDYHYLKQINNLAFSQTIPHTKTLMKTPCKPIPYKKAKMNEADQDWFARFTSGI